MAEIIVEHGGVDDQVFRFAGHELRGGNRAALTSVERECIVAGPRDTGKTVGWCLRYHALCQSIPNGEFAIMRKVRATLASTVLRTFFRVAPDGYRVMGGDNPTKLVYPNGSTLWFGGLDDPGKTLSSERDGIYVNQAEELTLNDWETLSGATSGRAGHVTHPQLSGDCNPGGRRHWIKQRAKELDEQGRPRLRLISVTHRDNPALFDQHGEITEDGKGRIAVLAGLSGVRRKRLFEGLWATQEGAVYDMFDALGGRHVCQRDPAEIKRWFLCQDKGYTHPAVILLVGDDEDGRRHVFREFHRCGVLQTDVVRVARQWFVAPGWAATLTNPGDDWSDPPAGWHGQACEVDAVDAAAADLIAELINVGVNAVGGKGRVQDGIALVQNRLKVLGDGRPRLSVDPVCTELINELESYHYKEGSDEPVKDYDHGPDALRYLEDALSDRTGAAGDEHRGQLTTGAANPLRAPAFQPRPFQPRQWGGRR